MTTDDQTQLDRCPNCGEENNPLCVSSGACAWCGWAETDRNPQLSQTARRESAARDARLFGTDPSWYGL